MTLFLFYSLRYQNLQSPTDMAESAPSSLASGGQHDDHASKPKFASTGLENQEEGDAREGDYDVETVERIYRFVITGSSVSTYNLPI